MAAFTSVQYIDPFAPLPIGVSQAGVLASLSATGVPSGSVAYAQLVANLTPVAYGVGATPTLVRVLNTAPLAPTIAYVLQVQFAPPGADPANLDWSNAAAVISSPVVAQQLRVTSLTVTPTGLTFAWEAPSGGALAGGYLQVIDATTNTLTGAYYLGVGPAASLTATFTANHTYQVTLAAVQPVTGGPAGTFAAPYTIGPATTAQPLPTMAPVVSRATLQDDAVTAQWTAPAAPSNAPSPGYDLVLLDGANLVAVAPAGGTGGQLVSGQVSALSQPKVAARMRYGDFVGPVGASVALSPLAPQVLGVTLIGTPGAATITAQLASPGPLSTGGALVATLYANNVAGATQSLSTATGPVSWPAFAAAADTVYEIDVALVTTTSGLVVQGPRSPRVATPLVAPQNVAAVYDGQTVTLELGYAAAPAADGYTVVLAGSGGVPSQTFRTAAQLPIAFPANLDVSKTWTATVTPSVGVVSGLSAQTTVVLPTIAAPRLTSVIYDGEVLSLQWSAASLPFLDGYAVAVAGQTALVAANQTACALPLSLSLAAGASVTITGVSPLRDSAASPAVAVLTNLVEISSVQVSANVVASWSASGAPPAMRAELLAGDTVQSVIADATATGVTFAVPTATSQPYRLRARAVSADGVSAGPPSAAVDLLLNAPNLISGQLGDGQLSLRWAPVSPFTPAGYLLQATPISGDPASLRVTGDSYDGPAPAAFSAAGTLKITPTNAVCAGPAVSVPINAAGAVASAVYDGAQLVVTADVGSGLANDTFWFEVTANGAPAARAVVVASGAPVSTQVAIPVALAQGASASVRMSGVGPASLTPPSPPAAIPTTTPNVVSAAYDGTNLHVRWTPTPGPGVGGYVITVANASIADTYVAGADSFTQAIPVSLTYPFASNITVTVRAAFGSPSVAPYVKGPSSLPLPPTLAGHALSSGLVAAGDPPYVYRRGSYQALADVSGKPIVLYLPKPFTGTDNPTIPSSDATSFELAPAAGSPPLPYQLTLGADVWTTLGADPVRSPLRDTYVSFLSAVEDAGVYPWALNLIRQIIAQAMPQTYQEVLYYRYGLWRSDSLRVVDLTPGTRLQVSNAVYQAIVGGTSAKNGFLATGAETLDLVDAIPQGGAGTLAAGAGRSLSVDAFLSLLYPGGGANASRPVTAGPIDFFDSQNRQPYYRLFYPQTPFASGSNGSTALQDNVTLIGTTSWKTLSAITDSYAQTGVFPTGTDYFATYFRGRASLTPLINVSIQGEQRWATLGTSVRQALSAQGLAPYFGGAADALSMVRACANLFDYSTASLGLTQDPVNLGDQDMGGLTPLYWPLDMPLVGGDQVSLRQL